jgi:hypothetical protein
MANQNGQINPRPLRLDCLGLRAGGHTLPPFRLHAGEAVCMHVQHSPLPWYDGVLPLLQGKATHPALRLLGTTHYLERPIPRRTWFGRRKDCAAQEWLMREQGLSSEDAARVLQAVSVPPDLRVGWMGWNERTMLALEVCLLRPPDVLVFDAAGNDLMAINSIFNRLVSRPSGLAIVYLKTNLDEDSPCLPGASCLMLTAGPLQTTAVE